MLEGLRDTSVRHLFEDMDPDDRARLVDEMPAKVAKQLLAGLSPRERTLTATLLGYPENSAGRVMSPEVVNLKANQTVSEALNRLRRIGASAETIYALPMTDDARRLVGALGLRDLVLADPETPIGDLMDREVYSARVDQDQEEIARLIQEADLLALPIVDTEGRLVGIVTVDDAMQILEEEQTEDVARAGGAEPLEHPYLSVSVLGLARSRFIWLLVADRRRHADRQRAAPVRGHARAGRDADPVHSARHRQRRQCRIAIGHDGHPRPGGRRAAHHGRRPRRAARGARWGCCWAPCSPRSPSCRHAFHRLPHGGVVSLTLLAVCTLATLVGSLLPLLARRLGFDPAVMSAPFISTLVDASGLILYFMIAKVGPRI